MGSGHEPVTELLAWRQEATAIAFHRKPAKAPLLDPLRSAPLEIEPVLVTLMLPFQARSMPMAARAVLVLVPPAKLLPILASQLHPAALPTLQEALAEVLVEEIAQGLPLRSLLAMQPMAVQ